MSRESSELEERSSEGGSSTLLGCDRGDKSRDLILGLTGLVSAAGSLFRGEEEEERVESVAWEWKMVEVGERWCWC